MVLTGDLVDFLHRRLVLLGAFFGSSDSATARSKVTARLLATHTDRQTTHLCTREGGANTPYLGRQLK